ncbi:MAG: DUF3800 domain-containing protein [Spirochaetes bacterium]|nr:DUF3800 domain-containing protein [Spirochaetota bacterium]
MEDVIAFADEFGNNSFEFDKQGTHFIVASIICKVNAKNNLEVKIEELRKKYFQTGEMKSSKVGPNFKRRKKILSEIIKNDFQIYAVIVDKTKLFGEGFKYKKSFYKYLNGLLYHELFRTFPNLNLSVDEHGSNSFMRSFKKYVEKNHIRDLFNDSEIIFISSPDNVLIQLADFIAGTLGYIFDESKKTEESSELREILESKITKLDIFPSIPINYRYEPLSKDLDYNEEISNLSITRALDFIDRKKNDSKTEIIHQVNCVKYLLLALGIFKHNNFISTKEIIGHLKINSHEEISEYYFRSSVIARIRDEGVILTSCSAGKKTGYKLPSSIEDLNRYVNHTNNIVLPMLKRVKSIRNNIKLGTHNKIDILNRKEFEKLKKVIDSY